MPFCPGTSPPWGPRKAERNGPEYRVGGCLTVDSHGGGTRLWDLDVSWPHLPIVLSATAPRLPSMWESSEALWRRLNLGRAEYLQRLITTLIVGGDQPAWNTPRSPSERGGRFLRLLDEVAHDDGPGLASAVPEAFLDEYRQLEDRSQATHR